MKITKVLFINILTFLLINSIYPQGFNSIGSPDGIYVLAAGKLGKNILFDQWRNILCLL